MCYLTVENESSKLTLTSRNSSGKCLEVAGKRAQRISIQKKEL
jgi:hypothetical protein